MNPKRVRIKDIADKAGVSTGTVDRVLHERGYVSEEARQRVLDALEEMGYERNLLASALAYNKAIRIVALMPDKSTDPYWEQPFAGVEQGAQFVQPYGIEVETRFFNLFERADFRHQANAILENPPAGLLFPPLFLQEGQWLLEQCREKGIAAVTFNTQIDDAACLAYIGQDSYQSGVLAARLLNFGLSGKASVLLLNLEKEIANARHLLEKERGFRDYFAQHQGSDIQVLRLDVEQFEDKEALRRQLDTQLHKHPDLAGVFVSNSRAYRLADCLPSPTLRKLRIVGFDLVAANLQHLQAENIDFLINQNSVEQGYNSVLTLYRHLFLKEKNLPALQYLPLDSVVVENVAYYL